MKYFPRKTKKEFLIEGFTSSRYELKSAAKVGKI